MSRVAGLCTSMEIRSADGSALTFWFHSSSKAMKHSVRAWNLCSQLFTGP